MLPAFDMDAHDVDSHDQTHGRIAGRYEIVRSLGEGAYAVVYEAADCELGRRVALKLFCRHGRTEIDAALHEARAMARINHGNVLQVHDFGDHRGIPVLALEYADTDLRRWLAAAPRDPAEILRLYIEAGRGLAAVHRAGLVHHDIKPANVMLRADGSAAVGDFGLARAADELEAFDTPARPPLDVAADAYALGTLLYIAPERLLGEPGDARSDQFSFCVAVWEALAGVHPFFGADVLRRYESIARGPSGSPRAPSHVARALRRGLSLDPKQRWPHMDELLTSLEAPASATRAAMRRGLPPALSIVTVTAALAVAVMASREAPAVDFHVPEPAVLTATAGLDHALAQARTGDPAAAMQTLTQTMPVVRQTDTVQQRAYLERIEVLGDVLLDAGHHQQAAYAFAAAVSVAKRLDLPYDTLAKKRAIAQSRRNREARAGATPRDK